jgi:hypothetical protein
MTLQDRLDALYAGIDEERNKLRKMQDQLERLTRAIQVQTCTVSFAQDRVIDLLIATIEIKEEN